MRKALLLSLLALLALAFVTDMHEASWGTDIEAAKKEAKASDRLILLSFSGSDWCGNCIRLEKTLFESEEFAALAKDQFVLVNADFPARAKNKKLMSAELLKQNEALAEKYNKTAKFPTVLVLDAEGNVKGKLVHPKETAAEYLVQLKEFSKN